jgi:hypothetical protein
MKYWLGFMAIGLALMSPNDSFARSRKPRGVGGPCGRIVSVQSGQFIYKNSAPLRAGGIGTRIVGFRSEPTLIMNSNVSSRGSATIYDASGNSLGSCPWTSAHGHSGGRYRCTMQTGALRRKAMGSTRRPAVYIKLNNSTCVEVPDAGRCYGSSKGLCNRTIN